MPAAPTSISPHFMTPIGQLALDGGAPILASGHNPSGYDASWPPTGHHEVDVLRQVRSRAAADRPRRFVGKLERRWRDATGRSHSIACRSGSAALRVALAGLEIEGGEEVIFPADSVHLARALTHSGVVGVAVDLGPQTLHIDPMAVEAAITERTRAVIAVDQHGTTADYRSLEAIAGANGLALIEDCSQSLGAMFDHRPVGSHGDLSICALQGEDARSALGTGGLVATDDDELAANARLTLLVNNGAETESYGPDDDPLSGWTCRLSELDAAMGEARLRRVDDELAVRAINGSHLINRLSVIAGIWVPEIERGASHVYSSLPLLVLPDELGLPEAAGSAMRDAVIDCMTAEGLRIDRWQPQPGQGLGGWPIERQPGRFPVTEALVAAGLVLGQRWSPFGPPQTIREMDEIADCFSKIFAANSDRLRQLTLERFHTHVMA